MVSTVQTAGMCFTRRLQLVASLGDSNGAFLGPDCCAPPPSPAPWSGLHRNVAATVESLLTIS